MTVSISTWRDLSWCTIKGTKPKKAPINWKDGAGKKVGIYAIRVFRTTYIGLSANKKGIRGRISQHISDSRKAKPISKVARALQKAFKQKKFKQIKVALVEEWKPKKGIELGDLEAKWIKRLRPSMNSNKGGGGGWSRKRVKAYLDKAEKEGKEEDLQPCSPMRPSRVAKKVNTPNQWYGVNRRTYEVLGSPGLQRRAKNAIYVTSNGEESTDSRMTPRRKREKRQAGLTGNAVQRMKKYARQARESNGSGRTPHHLDFRHSSRIR